LRCCFKDSKFGGDVSKWKPTACKKMQGCFDNCLVDTSKIKWIK
jgi:hypothetical protein